MKKKLMFALIALIVLLAGCGGQDDEPQVTGPASGKLTVSTSIDDKNIEAGEGTTIEVTMSNMYSNSIENVEITLEPLTSGITYEVSGPTFLEANKTETWDVDLDLSEGLAAKEYNLYPVICFDYTQERIGFFRVADGEPSVTTVDYSLSDSGPMGFSFHGLKSFNVNQEDEIDVTVGISIPTKTDSGEVEGIESIYNDEADVQLTSGSFKLDTVGENLRLFTNERDINAGPEKFCQIQTSGSNIGYALCYFNSEAGIDGADNFDFDIETTESLTGELESSFAVEVTARLCFKAQSSVTSITVVEST